MTLRRTLSDQEANVAASEAGKPDRPYKIFKVRGGFRVEDPRGKTRGKRKRLSSARDLANRLSLGLKTYAEARQVLLLWPPLKIRTANSAALPYVLKTSDGIAVKRFKRRFHAEWWLDRYENRRLTRASQLREHHNPASSLDALEQRWLISDDGMCYPERVVEIMDLLKAGLA
jgi:hypothetical protein